MPRSHRLCWCCAFFVLASSLTGTAEESPRANKQAAVGSEPLVSELRQLADAAKFGELEQKLLQQPTTTAAAPGDPAYAATLLYIAQQAYAAGRREFAERWLRNLEKNIAPTLKPTLNDALLWVQCDPLAPQLPTPLLLEQATKHGRSSLAAVALMQRADQLDEQDRHDEAVWVYHELARLFATSRWAPTAMLKAAKLHQQLEQPKETLVWTQRLIEEHPKATEVPGALYLLASAASQLSDEPKASQALERLVAEHTKCVYWPDAAYRLAELETKAQHYDRAVSLLSQALQHAEVSAALKTRIYLLQAQVAITQKQWLGAEETLARALALNPGPAILQTAQFWQAEAAYQRGENVIAAERFAALAREATFQNTELRALIPWRQAQLAVRRQAWPEVFEYLEQLSPALQKQRSQEIDYLRARAHLGLARFREARSLLDKLVATKSTTPSETVAMAHWLLGESYFLQRQYEAALTAYDATLDCKAFPHWQAAALLQSAKCCEQLARKEEAHARYERVVQEFPSTTFAAEAKRRLKPERSGASLAEQPMSNEIKRK